MTRAPGESSWHRRDILRAAAALTVGGLAPTRGVAQSQQLPPDAPELWRSGARLRWSPPPQSSPMVVSAGSSYFSSPAFAPNQDAVINLPNSVRRAGADIQINGGRHIRLIGGHTQGRVQWVGGTGSIFIEGLIVDLTATPNRDALVVAGAAGSMPDVYLQNIVVTGVQGTFAGTHADVFQPYGPIGHLRVHGFAADSNYQGFFIRPENPILSATFSRVSMKFNRLGTPQGNTFLFWCRNIAGSPAKGDPFFPVKYGPDVYAEANDRSPGHAAAFPPPGISIPGPGGHAFSGELGPNGSIRWPGESGISGEVLLGPPPNGDFVQRDTVGIGYRSPGYAA